ncbi:MAG: hypothetical protein H0X47_05935 [Nitrospirales bacterium]|nr:hypothetical protein [Nitrospirales bacterium]
MNSPGVIQRKVFLFLVGSVCLVIRSCSGLPRPVTYHGPLTAPEHMVLGETYVKQGDK